MTHPDRPTPADRIAAHYERVNSRPLPAAQILAACVIGCMGLAVIGVLALIVVHAARAIDAALIGGLF